MTKDTSYGLGRFEIIEKKSGEIWWGTHAGFGPLDIIDFSGCPGLGDSR